MKRVFSSPNLALVAGAALRLLFALKYPSGSGDTVIYEQLATNWLQHGKYAMDIAGQPVPVDIRMPGYPAFLALVYALTGQTGEAVRRAVLLSQIVVDLATCLVIAALAALLASLWMEKTESRRIFRMALWLAALCPFIANYVAVPLTEVWAVFFTALTSLLLVAVLVLAAGMWLPFLEKRGDREYWLAAGLSGLVAGLGTLFRPETPLLLVIAFLALACVELRQRRPMRLLLS